MKSEKAYLIGRLGGYGAASMLLAEKNVCEPQPSRYKVPRAHVEMHERMMAGQHQLIIPVKYDESTND